jgi:hypothetical protein
MTSSLHKSPPKKRKHSDSPTRKKARTGDDTPATVTPVPAIVQTAATEEEEFQAFMRDIVGAGVPLPTPPLVAQAVPATPPPATAPKPLNPFAGSVKSLRGNFGTGAHDVAHFQPTQHKVHHGVWNSRKKVKEWVGLALDSIYNDDGFVVASKPGQNGGYTYLVSMDGKTVGYLSGSSVPPGTKPPAKHIEVYLDKKGTTVSAFPSSPDIF